MGNYTVAAEGMNLAEKEEFLREIGADSSMMKAFDGYKPKRIRAARQSPPLDQKMTLTVTKADRKRFEKDLQEVKKEGENVSISQFVRHKALASPDIFGWKQSAISAIEEMKETVNNKGDLIKRVHALDEMIDEEKDKDIISAYYKEKDSIEKRLSHLKASPTKRTQRLSGRVTFAESELIKWRASRLCISTSDYLRMMIFELNPNSEADKHMSLAARQRFYIAIGDVAKNGWGEVPSSSREAEHEHLLHRIKELEQENRQLREALHNDRVNF